MVFSAFNVTPHIPEKICKVLVDFAGKVYYNKERAKQKAGPKRAEPCGLSAGKHRGVVQW